MQKKVFKNQLGLLLLGFIITSLLFSSCSSDDNNNGDFPKTLNYKRELVAEFKMYVGSATGGKEVITTTLDPKKYWKEYFTSLEALNPSIRMTFNDKETVKIISNEESGEYKYKVENNIVYLYDERYKEWSSFGFGNTNSLTLKSGLTRYHYIQEGNEGSGTGNGDEEITFEDVIGENSYIFKSLSDLKSVKDTVMWCNVHFIYE